VRSVKEREIAFVTVRHDAIVAKTAPRGNAPRVCSMRREHLVRSGGEARRAQ
jgi:hypothetical protein